MKKRQNSRSQSFIIYFRVMNQAFKRFFSLSFVDYINTESYFTLILLQTHLINGAKYCILGLHNFPQLSLRRNLNILSKRFS